MVTQPAVRPGSRPTGAGAHASFHVAGWRYMGVEVAYERRTFVGGHPLLFAVLAGASALIDARTRREAARLAAPRWRPLGGITVEVQRDRLRVLHQGMSAAVWFDAINAVQHGHDGSVVLLFVEDPPYAFTGNSASHLASELRRALEARHGQASSGS